MKKAKQGGTDVYLSLLDWRNTPSEGKSTYPAQRMFGCRTRTLLPVTSSLLKPKDQDDVKEKLIKQKSKQTKYYDRTNKELPPLQSGEIVRVAPNKVTEKENGSRHVLKNKLTFGRTKSGLKMANCTEEIIDTFASPGNHLVKMLIPVLCATATQPDQHITYNS